MVNVYMYRTSIAVKHDLYHFIDEVYSVSNVSQVNMTKYNIGHLDTKAFLMEAAHQIEDVIDR